MDNATVIMNADIMIIGVLAAAGTVPWASDTLINWKYLFKKA